MDTNFCDSSWTKESVSSWFSQGQDICNFNGTVYSSEETRHFVPTAAVANDEAGKNIEIAREWMETMNTCPRDNSSVRLINSFFQSKDTKMIMEDGEVYTADEGNKMLAVTFQSFPDFTLTWGEISTIDGNPNKVIIHDVIAAGTFTGKPYTILPGVLPALMPTGKRNVNDKQRFELTIKNGKITLYKVYAIGVHTGFAGFYVRAGGSLIPIQRI